jgi:hypothetical protein
LRTTGGDRAVRDAARGMLKRGESENEDGRGGGSGCKACQVREVFANEGWRLPLLDGVMVDGIDLIRQQPFANRMALPPAAITNLLAVVLMLLLAGWLLYLDFESRVNRSLSVFLLFRAMISLCNTMLILDPGAQAFWVGVRGYFFIAVVPALAYFVLTYGWAGRNWAKYARWAILGLVPIAELFYWANHCLDTCEGPNGLVYGPLSLFASALPLAYAITALALVREALPTASKGRARAARLVSLGFLLNALVDGTLAIPTWFNYIVQGADGIYQRGLLVGIGLSMYLLALLVALLAAAFHWQSARNDARGPYRSRLPWLVLLAILSGVFVSWSPDLPYPFTYSQYFLLGIWRLVVPALVVYAILRHQLFDLDVKLRFGVRIGGLAGIFVSVFFVATEAAQNILGDATGSPLLGVILAGSLVFFLHPLQKFTERFAQRAIPETRPIKSLSHADRIRLFADQATLAWSDGALTRRERLLLTQLQERLGISIQEAAEAESLAAGVTRPSAT